ncbi:hypothetical protein D4R42_01435 [bacterium]|nr:MAG: hypothetical protein D4R42_01435 [bacterium]
MKTVFDATISKKPIQVPEPNDILALSKTLERTELEVELLELRIQKLNESDDFAFMIEESEAREQELLKALACVDPHDAVKMATIQGQIAERFKLTGTINSLHNVVTEKRSVCDKIKDTISKWSNKMNKMAKEN